MLRSEERRAVGLGGGRDAAMLRSYQRSAGAVTRKVRRDAGPAAGERGRTVYRARVSGSLLSAGHGEAGGGGQDVTEVIKMMSSRRHAVFDRTAPCKSPQTLLMPSVSRVIGA